MGVVQHSHIAQVSDARDFQGVYNRLDTLFQSATPQQLIDGLAWYDERNAYIGFLASVTGLTAEVIAAALSALSAQTNWANNLRAINDHVQHYVNGGTTAPRTATLYGANDDKAWAILTTENPALIGKGEKTISFAKNLLLDDSVVTVDSIMHAAATGWTFTQGIRGKRYATIAAAVKALAAKYGIKGYQFQAVVWVVWRGTGE